MSPNTTTNTAVTSTNGSDPGHVDASTSSSLSPPLAEAARDALAAALEHSAISRTDLAEAARGVDRLTADQRKAAAREVLQAARVTVTAATGADPDDAAQAVFEAAQGGESILAGTVDLGALLKTGIPPVEYLDGDYARRMVYGEGVTGFTGHPDSGKTSLVVRLAVDAMRQGRTVVYLDFENGERTSARRFAAVGADPELLTRRLVYRPMPASLDFDQLGAVWDRYPDAVGVFDSTRGILRRLGLSENEAGDTAQFFDPLSEFALSRHVPILLIDHVTKGANASSMYARGSGDKLAAVQAQWYVDKTRAFDESTAGEIELVRWKARDGGLSARFRFAVGDGEGQLSFRRLSSDKSPQGRMEADVICTLRAVHPASCSLRDVEGSVEGTAAAKRATVKRLAENPTRPVAAVEEHGYTRYVYVPEADREPGVTNELAI